MKNDDFNGAPDAEPQIRFFADDHFGQHSGKVLFEGLPADLRAQTDFRENDLAALEDGRWAERCALLVLHLIGGTCGQPHAGVGAEKAVRGYIERGGNVLLLHGSSAAFWQWAWWRELVGLRWVRPGDPDGVEPSTHPHAPCSVTLAKTRHLLARRLRPFDLPDDEIYTALEETAPVRILMETEVGGRTWPQCCETISPAGGRIVSFIPGHRPECTSHPDLAFDVAELIRYLLEGRTK